MTKFFVTTLAIAAAAGAAMADGPARPFMRPGVPVISPDGSGGFQRAGGLVNFDFVTAESWDSELDPDNELHFINITETTPLTEIAWSGTLTTVGASWLSEAVIYFGTPDPAQAFYLTMGAGDDFSGSTTYTGSADLVSALGYAINPAGTWEIEFFESFDDIADGIDGHWRDVGIGFVPAPGSVALLGLGGLMVGRRRR